MPRLLESDAEFLTLNYDALSLENQAKAQEWFSNYRQQQADDGEPLFPTQEKTRAERQAWLRSMFEAPDKIDYDPGPMSLNPELAKMQHANMALLSARYQKEPAEVASRYDFLLNDYARQKLGASEDVDTAKFYALAQKDMQRVKLREDTQREGMSAALRGEDGVKALAAWQAKNADRAKDDAGLFMRGYQQALEQDGEMLPIADRLLKALESGTDKTGQNVQANMERGQVRQELGQMVEQLAGMKKAQRKSVYRSIAARIEAAGYDQKGFWSQMLGELDKGLYRMEGTLGTQAGQAADVMSNFPAMLAEGMTGNRDFGMTPAETAKTDANLARRERIGNVQEEIMQIVSGELDPVRPTTGWMNETIETGLIKGPGAVAPFMAASALLGPYGAGLVFTADFAEQNRRELVQIGLDADQARKVGAMAAPLQAAVESLSNMVSLGKFPAVQAALPRFTRPVGGASLVGRYVQNSLISGATEFTEEQIQDNLVVPAMQELLGALEKDVPEVDWSFYKTRAANSTPELAATLLPMALVFGGVMTAADAKLSRTMTQNVELMMSTGMDQAQAVDVASQPTQEQRIRRGAELWNQRKGTKASMEEAQKKLADQYRTLAADSAAAVKELEARGVLPRLLPMQGGEYRLTFNDGSTADFKTREEALGGIHVYIRDRMQRSTRALRETIDTLTKNLEQGREFALEISPEAMPADEAVKRGIISPQALQERAAQGAILDATTLIENSVLTGKALGDEEAPLMLFGMSKNEWYDKEGRAIGMQRIKDDILRTTMRLWDGASPLTLIEEKTEGDAKVILSTPGKRQWMLDHLRAYEDASGDKLFTSDDNEQINDKQLIEAWSHMAQSYFVAAKDKVKGRTLGRYLRDIEEAELTAAMQGRASWWQAVVNRAQKLGELKAAGKLNEDVVAELEKQLGIDSQVKHEQGAMQEAQNVANEVAQQVDTSGYSEANPGPNGETFAARRAIPADASKVVQMPDGARLVGPTTFSIRKPTKKQLEKILPGAKYIAPDELMNADIRGPVVIGAYHGTTHTIEQFTDERANLENDMGAGVYASTSIEDVNANYAGEGPDLTQRIELTKEQLVNDGMDEDEAEREARSMLKGHGGAVIPLLLPMRNPVVLWKGRVGNAANKGTFIEFRGDVEQYRDEAEELVMDREGITRDELPDYQEQVQDAMYEIEAEKDFDGVLAKIARVVDSFDDTDSGALVSSLDPDGMYAADLEQELRKNEGTVYATSGDNGQLAVGELVRRVFMDALGFDGIIDKNVNNKFGSRGRGKAMAGMDDNTAHIIVATDTELRPRSAFNTDTTFSLRVTPAQDAEYMAAVEAGDMEKAQRMVDEAAKAAGYNSASVIHSTNAEFNSFGRVRWVSTIKGRSEVITPIKSTGIGLIYATQDSAYSALFGDKQLKLYHNISNPADLRSLGSRNVSDSAFDATLSTLGIAHKSSSMGAAPVFERLNKGQHKKAMLEAGFDGFALRERSGDLEADAIAGFDSSQFKSADPVTRDESGNVIPLSQRFNPADDRITYSLRPGDFASRAIPADASKVVQMPDGARLVGPTTFSIRAFHGTPHKVDKFRLDKIGTGEGAQAYGWGLYFAESRDVADGYAVSTLTAAPILWDGAPYNPQNPAHVAGMRLRVSKGDREAAITKLEAVNPDAAKVLRDGGEAKPREKGNLYTVELLPDEGDFLDWDKPLSEQSEKVKKGLTAGGVTRRLNDPASVFYEQLAMEEGSEKAASKYLASLGIPGIRYLDQGSRGAGDGTRNFVIFDENLVRILEENGKPVAQETFSLRVTPAQDAEYMAAVEAGDMEKAQRMVDEVAKAADVTYTAKVPVSRLSYGELPGVGEERKLRDGDAQPLIVERTGAGDTLALADGYHRLEGMILNGETEVTVIILNSKDSDAVSGLSEQREFRRIQEEHKGESADPVTRDDAGNVIPLSQRFNPADDRITYSLRPGDFASRVEAMFSPFQRSPEARLIMTRVAKSRALKLGQQVFEASIRTMGSIDREARVREALAEDKAVQDYLDSLTPAARQTLEWQPADLQDDPLVAAMLDFGKLMSKTTALQRGKLDLKMGDFDGAPWLPPSFYSKGAGIMPDQMAQAMFDAGLLPDAYTDTLWAELSKRIEATRKDKAAHREAVQAFKDAKKAARDAASKEAGTWADNAKKQAGSGKAQRDRIKAWIKLHDAILAAIPAIIRHEVGSFAQVADYATDEAAMRFLESRVAKMDKVLEKYLKKNATGSINRLFKKAAADYTAGKKAKGKLGPDEHYLFQRAEAASEMDAAALRGELAKLDALADDESLSDDQRALAVLERGIVELVGDMKNADSGRLFTAFDELMRLYSQGVVAWKAKQTARREARQAVRDALQADAGKSGVLKERQAMEKAMTTLFGKAKSAWLSVSSFSEVLRYAFGSKSQQATELIDGEREASNAYEDEQQAIADELESLFASMAGGKTLDGERLRFDMAQRTIKAGDVELSQFEAITALLMWRQEDGRRHMEGTFDEDGKRTSGWSYDQAWIDEVEKQLTPEGRRVMAWLAAKYGSEHGELNALYRERHGVNLPAHDNYAPLTVKPMTAKAGEIVDPVSGAAVSGSILTPGSLRTRSRMAIAEPEFRDALQTFVAHKKQMGYWKAYYDLATDVQAVLGNRELMNSVEAAAGSEAVTVLGKWMTVLAQGGVRDAAAGLAMNSMFQRMMSRAATVGLLGRVSTLLVQSTQLAAASVQMPVGAYLRRFGKLLAGQLDWKGALQSDFIQRRIQTAPPIVRQAMENLGTATRPNLITRAVRNLGNLLSGADGLFTGGTYAILLDYHRETGRKLGLTGADLEEHAHREAERATEQVAQPTRTATRSLAEITATNPLAKVSFAYASEARQKIALLGWSLANFKADPVRFGKAAFLVFGVGGVMSQVLKNIWKEAKGDDDEEKWSPERLIKGSFANALHGIPMMSELMGEPGMFSSVKWADEAASDLLKGEADLRDINTLLGTLGLFNDTAAGIAALSNAGYDVAKIIEAAFSE